MERFGRVCAAFIAAGGLVVLSGWALHRPQLTDWMGLGISMMPNTALALLLSAAALWMRITKRDRAMTVLALLGGAIGMATLLEHVLHVDLGMDQVLIRADWGQLGTISPGRMGLPASVMLVLLNGATLLSLRGLRARKLASVIAILCIAIASVSLIGGLFHARVLYVVPEYTAIALNTSILLMVLGLGLLAQLPDVEPMRTLSADSAAGTLVRRALPAVILVPVLIGWLRWQGEQAGLFDAAFATALRSIAEAGLLLGLLWWTAVVVGRHEEKVRTGEAALRTSEQRYQNFMQQSSEGIWRCELRRPIPTDLPVEAAVDRVYEHGYLAECNDAMARMYGYTRGSELVGVELKDLMPRSPENEAYIGAFIASGYRLMGGESEEVGRDGGTLYFSNNLMGVLENGRLARAWGTQRDITERKRAEHALLEADRRKDEFLATLAHELRNPLAPLTNGMELLRTAPGADAPEQMAVHAMMQRQLGHLVHLIDDLIDVSRINQGKIVLRLEEVELGRALHVALESSHPLVAAAGHRMHVDLPQEPLLLRADPVRLAQVFQNIVNNAVKYTPTGGTLLIQAAREDGHAVVSIQDTGIGLASDQLTNIFDLFRQVPNANAHHRDGLGIGLSLVKRLVEMHGGTVVATSEGLGKGSTFRVRLPLLAE